MIMELIFVNYWDVWGSESEGWEVNDVARHTLKNSEAPDTEKDVLSILIDNDIVHSDTSLDDLDLEFSSFSVEITERKTNRPFGRIEWEGEVISVRQI